MNSARRIKLRVAASKPRNPLVAPAAGRHAGSHRKSGAAQRRAGKMALKRQLKELP